jgi:hypothetical protein
MTGPRKNTFLIRAQRASAEPPVWRQLRVPGDDTMDMLATVLETAMGWPRSYRREFKVGDKLYRLPRWVDDDCVDPTDVTVLEVLDGVSEFGFTGDHSRLDVTVEGRTGHSVLGLAVCVAGVDIWPPLSMRDAKGLGTGQDAFDVDAVNAALWRASLGVTE